MRMRSFFLKKNEYIREALGAVYMRDCANSVSMRVCVYVCVYACMCVCMCVCVCVCEENRYRQVSTCIAMSLQYLYRHVSAVLVMPCLCTYVSLHSLVCPRSSVQVRLSVSIDAECVCLYLHLQIYLCLFLYLYLHLHIYPCLLLYLHVAQERTKNAQRMHKQFTWHLKRHQLLIAPHSSS